MTIEEKINKLEKISNEMEECSISEALKKYEESATLAKDCLAEINEYKGKITILTSEIGSLKEQIFKNN